jgi:hypothetical protein
MCERPASEETKFAHGARLFVCEHVLTARWAEATLMFAITVFSPESTQVLGERPLIWWSSVACANKRVVGN